MNNQSPYMQAYQAGIKLAAHEFFGKFANEELRDELIAQLETASEEDRPAILDQIEELETEARTEDVAPTAPAPASEPGFLDSLRSYLPTQQQMGSLYSSGADLGNNIMSGLDQTGDYISNLFVGEGAPEPAPLTAEEQSRINARNRAAMGFMGDIDPVSGESREALDYIARNPQQQAPAPKAPAPKAPAPEQPMGPPRELQNFTAVRGGYGKQLKALRGMGGLSEDDRDLLDQTNYRQLASAMGNRGLRVGDQFSVQDLLGRLRGQQARRDQGASSGEAIGTTAAPIQIQNRRGRTVNRGALRPRPQRPAAPRTPAPKPNVRSMVNQLGIKPNQPLNLGPAPSEADLLRSVGGAKSPTAPKTNQDLMGNMQEFPSIGF